MLHSIAKVLGNLCRLLRRWHRPTSPLPSSTLAAANADHSTVEDSACPVHAYYVRLAHGVNWFTDEYQVLNFSMLGMSTMPRGIVLHKGDTVHLLGRTYRAEEGGRYVWGKDVNVVDLSSMTLNCILGQNDVWVNTHRKAYISSGLPSFHSSSFGSPIYLSYVQRLCKLSIGNIDHPVIYHKQCNASDVVDLAIKAASMRAGGRCKVGSFHGSYHGQNLVAYLVSDLQRTHSFLVQPGTDMVEFFDPPPDASSRPLSADLLEQERNVLAELRRKADGIFALIVEPVMVNNGVLVLSCAFLRGLVEVCRSEDICLILDETQTCWGWLGKLTAAELYDLKPDIVILGKGLTAGYGPLALMVTTQQYGGLPFGTAEKTNGADLCSLAAADAVLDRLIGLDEDCPKKQLLMSTEPSGCPEFGLLRADFKQLTDALEEELRALKVGLQQCLTGCGVSIGDLRGVGLVRGIEILKVEGNGMQPNIDLTTRVAQACYDAGLFVRKSRHFLLIKPALVMPLPNLRDAIKRLGEAITASCATRQEH